MFKKWWRFVRQAASIKAGTDVNGTIEEIRDNVNVRGANIWLLVCSTILASIGLDLSSTAVIIGAMLISPLMSPILGVGLGFALLDRVMLRRALGNLMLATALALIASFLYFAITPLGELTPEIEARTTPTILDVGVAFFGGVAGIVAGSRKRKTSAIPGVAIATALMPPICTAGFGLAKGSTAIFFGAIYLYFINAFFIALATYLISRLLRFPARAELDQEQSTRVKLVITALALLIMLPSAVIFYGLIQKVRIDRGIRNFVNTEVRRDDRVPIRWDVEGRPESGRLKIYCVGRDSERAEIESLRAAMAKYGLEGLELQLLQMNVPRSEFERLASTVETDFSSQLKLLSSVVDSRQTDIVALQTELSALRAKTAPENEFLLQLKEGIDTVEDARWQTPATAAAGDSSNPLRVLIVRFRGEATPSQVRAVRTEIANAAKSFWPFEQITIIEEPKPDVQETPAPQP